MDTSKRHAAGDTTSGNLGRVWRRLRRKAAPLARYSRVVLAFSMLLPSALPPTAAYARDGGGDRKLFAADSTLVVTPATQDLFEEKLGFAFIDLTPSDNGIDGIQFAMDYDQTRVDAVTTGLTLNKRLIAPGTAVLVTGSNFATGQQLTLAIDSTAVSTNVTPNSTTGGFTDVSLTAPAANLLPAGGLETKVSATQTVGSKSITVTSPLTIADKALLQQAGDGAIGAPGSQVTLTVKAQNADGSGIDGLNVQWAVTGRPKSSSGGSVPAGTTATAGGGLASKVFTIGTDEGGYKVTAQVSLNADTDVSDPGEKAVFSVTGSSGAVTPAPGAKAGIGDCGDLPTGLQNEIDTTNGLVRLSRGADLAAPNPVVFPCTLAFITFKAKSGQKGNSTPLAFLNSGGETTKVTLAGNQTALTTTDGAINIIGPTITLTPSSGPGKSQFTIAGTNWGTGAVSLSFTDSASATTNFTGVTPTSGSFSTTVTLPSAPATGAGTVKAFQSPATSSTACDAGATGDCRTFTVTTPTLAANPASGAPGGTVSAMGMHFGSNPPNTGAITFKLNTTTLVSDPTTVTPDADGNFTANVTIPAGFPLGATTLSASQTVAGGTVTASTPFNVALVTVTAATGGTGISADTTGATGGTGAYTALTGPALAEAASAQIGTGEVHLKPPTGFEFRVAGAVNVEDVTAGSCPAGTGTQLGTGQTTQNLAAHGTHLMFNVFRASSAGAACKLSFTGLEVRPTVGTGAPKSGEIVLATETTALISGVVEDVTSLGALSMVAGAATKLGFTQANIANGTAGQNLSPNPVVAVQDQFGNTKTTHPATAVTLASVDELAPFGGPTPSPNVTCTTNPVNTSSGVASFANCSITQASTYHLRATVTTGLAAGDSNQFVLSKGAANTASHFTITPASLPANGSAMAQVDIHVIDAVGNPLPNVAVTVSSSRSSTVDTISDANGGTAGSQAEDDGAGTACNDGAAGDGVYCATITSLTPGTATITVNIAGVGDLATQNVIFTGATVTRADKDSPYPSPAPDGISSISADTANNASGGGSYTTLNGPIITEGGHGDIGQGTIRLAPPLGFQFNTGGTPTVAATVASGTTCNLGVTSPATFDINGVLVITVTSASTGDPCKLTVSGLEVKPTSGNSPLASGNIVRDATPGTSLLAGVPSSQNYGTLQVVHGAPTTIGVNAPANATAGVSFSVPVTIRDQFGNAATTYTGTVTLDSDDAQDVMPAAHPFVTGDNGAFTFLGVTLKTAGAITITANGTTPTITGNANVTVAAATAASLRVTEYTNPGLLRLANAGAGSLTAGDTLGIRVTAYDEFNNVAAGYDGIKNNVIFSGPGTAPNGTVPTVATTPIGTAQSVTFTSGASNQLILQVFKPETVSLDVSGPGQTSGTINSAGNAAYDLDLVVSAAAPNKFLVTAAPVGAGSTAPLGSTITITAQVADQYDNPIAGAGRPLSWSTTEGTLSNQVNTIDVNGRATTNLTMDTATVNLDHVVTAHDTSTTGAIADGTVTVRSVPANPDHYIISVTIPTANQSIADGDNAKAGSQVTVNLQLKDAFENNFEAVRTFTWTRTSNPTTDNGAFVSSVSGTTNAQGQATINFTVGQKTGTIHTFSATDTGPTPVLTAATHTAAVTVGPGDGANYLVSVNPNTGIVAGTTVQATAQLRDQFNNNVPQQNVTVNWTSTNGGSFSNPGTGSTTDANGTTTVDFTTSTVSGTSHVLTATSTSPAATGSSAALTTTPGTAAKLQVRATTGNASAATVTAGDTLEVTVTALDSNNNTATSYTGNKTLLFSGPGLSPNNSAATVEGVAIGSPVTIAFTAGVSNAGAATLIARKAETVSLDVEEQATTLLSLRLSPAVGISSNGADTLDLDLTVNAAVAAAIRQSLTANGNNGEAAISTQLTLPFVATVTDRFGNAKPGANVIWTAGSAPDGASGQCVTASNAGGATSGSCVSTAAGVTVATDANGRSYAKGTLGNKTGFYTYLAGIDFSNDGDREDPGESVGFQGKATPGAAATISLDSGNNQEALVGEQLAGFLAVKITDAGGNPVAGVNVTFTGALGDLDPSTGGTQTTLTVQSRSDGLAGIRPALSNTVGAHTFNATATGLAVATGSPTCGTGCVQFTATARARTPASITALTGLQAGLELSTLSRAAVFGVLDAQNRPVSNVTVNFTFALSPATSTGGSLTPTSAPTTINGIVSTELTLPDLPTGTTSGTMTVTATVAGTAISTTYTANVTAINQMARFSGNGQTGVASSNLPARFLVVVADGTRNPVEGVPVSFSIHSSSPAGGSLVDVLIAGAGPCGGTISLTDAEGQAGVRLRFGATAGTYRVEARADLNGDGDCADPGELLGFTDLNNDGDFVDPGDVANGFTATAVATFGLNGTVNLVDVLGSPATLPAGTNLRARVSQTLGSQTIAFNATVTTGAPGASINFTVNMIAGPGSLNVAVDGALGLGETVVSHNGTVQSPSPLTLTGVVPGSQITVEVNNRSGADLNGAFVQLTEGFVDAGGALQVAEGGRNTFGFTAGTGQAIIPVPEATFWIVAVFHPSVGGLRHPALVPAGDVVVLTYAAAVTLTGNVTLDGAAAAGARVSFTNYGNGDTPAGVVVNGAGNYTVDVTIPTSGTAVLVVNIRESSVGLFRPRLIKVTSAANCLDQSNALVACQLNFAATSSRATLTLNAAATGSFSASGTTSLTLDALAVPPLVLQTLGPANSVPINNSAFSELRAVSADAAAGQPSTSFRFLAQFTGFTTTLDQTAVMPTDKAFTVDLPVSRTLSGTVVDNLGALVAGASVDAFSPFLTGSPQITGVDGAFNFSHPAQNAQVRFTATKQGFLPAALTQPVSGSVAGITLVLNPIANQNTISGVAAGPRVGTEVRITAICDSGKTVGTTRTFSSNNPVDYELVVGQDVCRVRASADGFKFQSVTNNGDPANTNSGSVTNVNLALTRSNPQASDFKTCTDTAGCDVDVIFGSSRIAVSIPPNAAGTTGNNITLTVRVTTDAPQSSTYTPVFCIRDGNSCDPLAVNIQVKDAAGNLITQFASEVTVTFEKITVNVPADAGTPSLGFLNDGTSNWVNLANYTNTGNADGTQTVTGQSTHLSKFSVITVQSFGAAPSSGSTGPSGGGGGSTGPGASPSPSPAPQPAGSATATAGQDGSASASIGGGASAEGGVSLSAPAGAFPPGTNLSMTVTTGKPATSLPAGTTQPAALQVTFDLDAGGVQPKGPVSLSFNPTPEQIAAAGGLDKIVFAQVKPDGTTETIPTTVNPDGTISATLTHFSTFTLVAVARPGPPLSQPPQGEQLTTMGPLLRWSSQPNTAWFQVQVIPFNDDGPSINLVIGDPAMVQAAQYQVMAPDFGRGGNYVMLPGMTYVWRVRTTTTAGTPIESDWTAWSARTFKTPAVSSAGITAVVPANNATVGTLRPALVWENSDRAVFYYEVQVSKDREFGPNAFLYWELRHGGVTSPPNTYLIPAAFPLEQGTTYYWRVRPRVQGDGTEVSWSTAWSFATAP